MGNFNKKYIIQEAENILQECNKKIGNGEKNNNQIIRLKIKNKKQKRKTIFWQVCTAILTLLLIISII